MIIDYAHAAALQACHDGPCIAAPTFTADGWSRMVAGHAAALVAAGIGLDRTALDDVLAEHLHDLHSTSPAGEAERAAEWAEAYRVAGLLIRDGGAA